MPKADKILTELALFLDPRSYVRRDGSEVLYGDDWKALQEHRVRRRGMAQGEGR